MKNKTLFILLILSLPLLSAMHKFYVSNTIIEWNVRTNNVEISCKLFTDDLERAIAVNSPIPVRLGDEREVSNANELVENYIQKNFHILIDDQPVMLRFVGKEIDTDLAYCYFEFVPKPSWNVMTIENTLLMDLFPEQKNIVDVRMNGWSKSIFLTKEKTKETIFR